RVFTELLPDGTPLNWGGTFIGDGHDRLVALVQEMGLETCRQYTKGDNLLFLDGKLHRYAGNVPRINPLALVDFGLAAKMLEWMAGEVPIDAPGTPPGPTNTTGKPSAPGSDRAGTRRPARRNNSSGPRSPNSSCRTRPRCRCC